MNRWLGLLLATLMLGACSSSSVFSLEEGDCFNSDGDLGEEVSQVLMSDCADAHDYEVYATFEMSESDFPGFDATADMADADCLPAFESFVGTSYATSELDFLWLIPTEESWASGDRQILCFLYRVDLAKMSGSMEGAGF